MGMNCGYGCSKPGILKIVTVVIGFVVWIWMGTVITSAYYFTEPTHEHTNIKKEYNEEMCEDWKKNAENLDGDKDTEALASTKAPCPKKWFVQTAAGFAFLIFLGSIIALLLLLCVELNKNGLFNQIDFIGHFVAGFLLVVSAILAFAYVAMVYGKDLCDQKNASKTCSENLGKLFAHIDVAICGALILINGIIYYVLGVIIQKSKA